MTKWRCNKDLVAYCDSEPEWEEKPEKRGISDAVLGGTCKLDPKTCGKHLTHNELCATEKF